MSLTTVLLTTALGLITYFGGYWIALQTFVLLQAFSGRAPRPPSRSDDAGPVTVLVPSHHEGASLVDTVRTLLDQDYAGTIAVRVLVEGFDDVSVASLREAYGALSETSTELSLRAPAGRALAIVAVGESAKHAKLNQALDRIDGRFVAFLDADHRADLSWIRNALGTLEASDAAGVQSRKHPLAVSSLAQVWDAGFSHVAFELFNRAAQRSFGGVAFTGSTAVFRVDAVAEHRFADCITEDTYFAYDLLLAGHRIVYDSRVGSYEEATPDIASFVFRRRRWAAGHTHAFAAHARRLLGGGASAATRVFVIAIGQFYLVPLAIALFFVVQGIYYFVLFAVEVRAAVLALSALSALALTLWLSWRRRTKLTDFFVCWLAIAPHVSMAGAFLYLILQAETFYFITSFPFQDDLWQAQSVLLGLGLASFAVAWWQLRPLRFRHALVFALTLPVMIFFDVLSALLGLSDLALRRREWSRIERRNEVSAMVDAKLGPRLSKALRPRAERWAYGLLLVPAIALAVVVTNDVLSIGPCGVREPLLWDPILLSPPEAPVLEVTVVKSARGDRLHVVIEAALRTPSNEPVVLRVLDETRQIARRVVDDPRAEPRHRFELDWPLGWASRRIGVSVSGTGTTCLVDRRVPTHAIDAGPDGLRVNGEPFEIQGIVSTFSAPGVGLDVDDAYRQFRDVGLNAVRIYHSPTPAILRAAQRHQLLLIPQPDQSTWRSIDPGSFIDRALYERRWRALVKQTEGNPYVLMLNAGNELEIDDRSPDMMAAIHELIRRAAALNHASPTTYSTFATFSDYPVDVLGINMLDSGPTYWDAGLDLVVATGRPFYASELGGFVAFFEDPPAALRRWRMVEQAAALRQRGSLGAVYFASHDNWSQAVPPGGYNDPFTGDHPDDRRGYWDPDNREKPELNTLARLVAEVSVEVLDEVVSPELDEVRLRVENRVAHTLRRVRLTVGGAPERWWVGDLEPGEARDIDVPASALRAAPGYPYLTVRFSFTSHHGLGGGGRWELAVPDPTDGPVLLGLPLAVERRSADGLEATALEGGAAELVVPASWRAVAIGGRVVQVTGGRIPVPLPPPARPVRGLESSADGATWVPFEPSAILDGDRLLRFELPRSTSRAPLLVLAGVAATRVHVQWSDGMESYPAHPYREVLIDASGRAGAVRVRMRRSRRRYVRSSDSPTGRPVFIELAPPFLFAPERVTVRRRDD